MIGMVIADDELLIREGLQSIPWNHYGIELKGVAANGEEALSLIGSALPDILLTDIRMPGMDGLELIERSKKIIPGLKTILLTGYKDFEYAHTAIRLGANGYVLKPSKPADIIQAVLEAKSMTDAEKCEKREKEQMRRQMEGMQVIVRNTVLVGRNDLRSDPEQVERLQVQNRVVQQVMEYIDSNFMKDITLMSVSEHVYMNHFYLSRLIKKETGENFLDILTRTRLRKACEMLADTNLRTYEVSEKVGIRDSGYFSQVFRKYFGMTPSEYREKGIPPKRVIS